MPDTAVTLGAALHAAAETLGAAGIPAPRREALRIWSGTWRTALGDAYLAREQVINEGRAAALEAAVARRAGGEPLAYVTGWTGFRRLLLRTDRRALIPRPETEGLVDLVLARVPRGRVADIGTGTGCIALSLAAEGGYDEVVAVDASTEALALAGENARDTGLRLTLLAGDLTHPLAGSAFDVVVSNPPYLTDAEYATLDPAVREWEPRLALPSGADGLGATARLLDDARRVVRPGGWLALEVDCARGAEAARRAEALGWRDPTLHHDLFGRVRYLLAQWRP